MSAETNQATQQKSTIPLSTSHSNSSSGSLVRIDEVSSFGANKQSRLPALMKPQEDSAANRANSMPPFNGSDLDSSIPMNSQLEASSLPAELMNPSIDAQTKDKAEGDKENRMEEAEESGGFQLVDMEQISPVMGPSLPTPSLPPPSLPAQAAGPSISGQTSYGMAAGPPSHLGDSLIEMVITLRNENQDLVRALETNNEFVKHRLAEFKKVQEEAKRREIEWASEKADFEHRARKLDRQNQVLSERLISMEAKLKDMRLEVGESLNAAHSSKTSSVGGVPEMYPTLPDAESFGNSALAGQSTNQQVTMQMDAANAELRNSGSESELSESDGSDSEEECQEGGAHQSPRPSAPNLATEVAAMSKEELEKRFDARKAEFYSIDDPMKQCDKLEQQLNEIGKRDYEICLLQQQLNIYRQDYRLEKMANLEAKIQIEKLKNDIDRLCLDRLQAKRQQQETHPKSVPSQHRKSGRRQRFEAASAATDAVLGKLGKRAAKTAAKAARYAAKQAHLEDKVAARSAAAAAAAAAKTNGPSTGSAQTDHEPHGHHHHKRHHRHQHSSSSAISGLRAVKDEVVSDLMSTANKAMLTGYRMASTHVNLALDKLSEFEQKQASNLSKNKPDEGPTVSAPKPKSSGTLMDHYDVD